jgi:hypothetical protein
VRAYSRKTATEIAADNLTKPGVVPVVCALIPVGHGGPPTDEEFVWRGSTPPRQRLKSVQTFEPFNRGLEVAKDANRCHVLYKDGVHTRHTEDEVVVRHDGGGA